MVRTKGQSENKRIRSSRELTLLIDYPVLVAVVLLGEVT
jgi:hypothetical protein